MPRERGRKRKTRELMRETQKLMNKVLRFSDVASSRMAADDDYWDSSTKIHVMMAMMVGMMGVMYGSMVTFDMMEREERLEEERKERERERRQQKLLLLYQYCQEKGIELDWRHYWDELETNDDDTDTDEEEEENNKGIPDIILVPRPHKRRRLNRQLSYGSEE